MELSELVQKWFKCWDTGDFENIPVTNDFTHSSPYGTIEGKKSYLELVKSNQDKFLGNVFNIHDEIYDGKRGCVRYTITNPNFSMEVAEWYFQQGELIGKVIAYYHIEGEIHESRKLSGID